MKTYTLTLTEAQAEIMGYALTATLRQERKNGADYSRIGNRDAMEGAFDRARRIEQVRVLLDTSPAL